MVGWIGYVRMLSFGHAPIWCMGETGACVPANSQVTISAPLPWKVGRLLRDRIPHEAPIWKRTGLKARCAILRLSQLLCMLLWLTLFFPLTFSHFVFDSTSKLNPNYPTMLGYSKTECHSQNSFFCMLSWLTLVFGFLYQGFRHLLFPILLTSWILTAQPWLGYSKTTSCSQDFLSPCFCD